MSYLMKPPAGMSAARTRVPNLETTTPVGVPRRPHPVSGIQTLISDNDAENIFTGDY